MSDQNKKLIEIDTIQSFGNEWVEFDQTSLHENEASEILSDYFQVYPIENLNANMVIADFGCGTGRWANLIAEKVDKLHCIEPSVAIEVAKKKCGKHKNITYINHSISDIPENVLTVSSLDFAYCLGVVHHIDDTKKAIADCVKYLKPNAPILFYIYYNLDNKRSYYRLIWKLSDGVRAVICRLPNQLKKLVTDVIAASVYLPLAKISYILQKLNISTTGLPLNYYSNHSFYTMRTDARDRFGTPLEHRYSKNEIFEG